MTAHRCRIILSITRRRSGNTGRKDNRDMYNGFGDPAEELKKRATAYRNAAGLFPAVRKTAETFDGKVYNCRFEKALQEATGSRVFAAKRYKWIEIYIYEDGRQITLAQIAQDALKDGKRIPADMIIESAREHRESLLKRATELETAIEKVPDIRRQIETLSGMICQLRDSIPYEVRDVYRLDYRITR